MRNPTYHQRLCQAVVRHPGIVAAARTGSQARGTADAYSDLDLLVIAADPVAVRDVRRWVPDPEHLLIAAFHRTHYGTLLWDDFTKADLAIFSAEDPPAAWVVHDFEVLKGDAAFADALAAAAAHTRAEGAAHRNPDASLDNVLLLLTTAHRRLQRGEALSAHDLLNLAAKLLLAFDRQQVPPPDTADWLDPRRRLEETDPPLADALHRTLFAPPVTGLRPFTRYLATRFEHTLTAAQQRVVAHLLQATAP